jgi:Haem-binding domain/Cytochrome P460
MTETRQRRIRIWLPAAGGVAIVFLLLQFVRPVLTTPPATAELQVPSDVKQILQTSCYACHSDEKRLAWFDKIVPAYQLVAHDVTKARKRLNFSELGPQPKARQRAILFEAVNQIQMGAMPLPRYIRLHPEAAVTPAQLAVLRDYLLSPAPSARAGEADADSADAQYRQWIDAVDKPIQVQDASNGIAFLPDYKNWTAISSTDRIDTATLRIIFGNDVAIKAIEDDRINPWPDGTTFAKVSWRQKPDENGVGRTGAFFQVAFMIKNKTKYAATAGWGWAQWVGAELKPYGAIPGFERECVACHAPLSTNDYVFTMPIRPSRSKR